MVMFQPAIQRLSAFRCRWRTRLTAFVWSFTTSISRTILSMVALKENLRIVTKSRRLSTLDVTVFLSKLNLQQGIGSLLSSCRSLVCKERIILLASFWGSRPVQCIRALLAAWLLCITEAHQKPWWDTQRSQLSVTGQCRFFEQLSFHPKIIWTCPDCGNENEYSFLLKCYELN